MQTPTRKGLALSDPLSHVRLWLTVTLGVAADLLSKSLAWRFLGDPSDGQGTAEQSLLAGWLRLATSKNFGGGFGFRLSDGRGLSPLAGRILTILLTLATCALILYLFSGTRRSQFWMHLACGLTLAGALGNLYDRLVFGYVRDFIQFTAHLGDRVLWPYVFNLADVYLVVGVAVLVCVYLFGNRRPSAGESDHESGRA